MFGENALDGSCLKFTGRFELFLFESLSRPLSSSMSLQRASLCPTPPHLKPLSILYQLVKTLQKYSYGSISERKLHLDIYYSV